MASWQDDEDFGEENTFNRATWERMRRQRAELQPQNPTNSTPGSRQLSMCSTTDHNTGKTRLPPRRQYYYSHVNSGYNDCNSDYNPVTYDADSPASKNYRFGATLNSAARQVDYVRLNRRHLKGCNSRKFIYPQKTYSEMFNQKKQLDPTNGKFFIVVIICLH